jgi:hypothetical protein
MENDEGNERTSMGPRKLTSQRGLSLSRSGGGRSSIRPSPSSHLLDSATSSPPSQDSDDQEWLLIQQNMQAAVSLGTSVDPNDFGVIDDECVRAITFNSPGEASSTRTHLDEVVLRRRSMELSEEAEYIDDYQTTMEGNFALMFAEVTLRRMNVRRIQKRELDLYELIDSLNLPDYPYSQWGERLEAAIINAITRTQ